MATNMKDAFKFGLGAGLGMALVNIALHMGLIILALLFFIPGIYMLIKENKKPVDKRNKTNIYIAYGLMIVGCIFGLGIGASFIFSMMMEDF